MASHARQDERWLSTLVNLLAPLADYHRVEVFGEEHWPTGPALLVSNHSGGASLGDALFLVDRYRRLGFDEKIHVLAHDIFFKIQWLSDALARIGVVRSCRANALDVLKSGGKVLVFPGSDLDSMRPFSARKEVRLEEQRGFLRLAQQAGVPLVPIAQAGTHETFIVLSQGKALADKIGLPRWARWHSFPLSFSLPYGFTFGPGGYLPYFPLPAKIQVAIGAPIQPPRSDAPDDIERAFHEVHTAMQSMLDDLYAKRKWPIWG